MLEASDDLDNFAGSEVVDEEEVPRWYSCAPVVTTAMFPRQVLLLSQRLDPAIICCLILSDVTDTKQSIKPEIRRGTSALVTFGLLRHLSSSSIQPTDTGGLACPYILFI
jgi:hypothetical protein